MNNLPEQDKNTVLTIEEARRFIEILISMAPENIRDYVIANNQVISLQNGDTFLKLSNSSVEAGDFNFVIHCIYISYFISDIAALSDLKARTAVVASDIFIYLSYFDEANKWANVALSVFQQSDNYEGQVEVYLILLNILFRSGESNLNKIENIFKLAFSIGIRLVSPKLYLSLLLTYADFRYKSQRDADGAASLYEQALELINDPSKNIAPITYFNLILNLSDIWIDSDVNANYQKIVSLLSEALKKAVDNKFYFFELCIYDKLCAFYFAAGKKSDSLKAIEKLTDIYHLGTWKGEKEKFGIDDEVGEQLFNDQAYLLNLLRGAQVADELRHYGTGIDLCREVVTISESNGAGYDRMRFLAHIKLFELYISADVDLEADKNYHWALTIFEQLVPAIQNIHLSLVVNTKKLYEYLFTDSVDANQLRHLSASYQRTGNGFGGITRRLIRKAYLLDKLAQEDLGELLDLERLLLLEADFGDSINWIETMHHFYAKINGCKVFENNLYIPPEGRTIKLPDLEALKDLHTAAQNLRNAFHNEASGPMQEEAVSANFLLSALLKHKGNYPIEQFATLYYNVSQIDENIIRELLSYETANVSNLRLMRLSNYQKSDELLKSLPRFDLTQYQNSCLAHYALGLIPDKVSQSSRQLFDVLISARFCKMYTILGLEELRQQWWDRAASMIMKMSDSFYREDPLFHKAINILARLTNRDSRKDNYSSEILLLHIEFASDGPINKIFELIQEATSAEPSQSIGKIDALVQEIQQDVLIENRHAIETYLHVLKGAVYRNNNQFDMALECYRTAHLKAVSQGHLRHMAIASSGMAGIYQSINKLDKAKYYLKEAVRLSYLSEDDEFRAISHYDLGFHCFEMDNIDMAIYHLGEVVRLSPYPGGLSYAKADCIFHFLILCKKYNMNFFGNNNNVLADKSCNDGDITSFVLKAEKAIEISKSHGEISDTGLYYRLLGNMYCLRDLDRAYFYAEKAVHYYKAKENNSPLKIIQSSFLQLQIIEHQYRFNEITQRYDFEFYVSLAQHVLFSITKYKRNFKKEDWQMGFMSSYQHLFTRYLEMLMCWGCIEEQDENRLWEIYHLCQFVKADILNQDLAVRNACEGARNLLAAEESLLFSIAKITATIEAEQGKPVDLIDNAIIEDLTNTLEKYEVKLQQTRDVISELRFGIVDIISEKDRLADFLKKNTETSFLDFFVMQDRYFSWYIKPGAIKLFSGALPKNQLYAYLEKLKKPASVIEADFVDNGIALFQELVGQHIPDFSGISKVKIIPHGLLYNLPFETLITNRTKDGFSWFLESPVEISYVYSINTFLLFTMNSSGKNPSKITLASFAKSQFANINSHAMGTLQDIHYTLEEVGNVSCNFDDKKMFLESDCTKEMLINALSHGVQYLHIATHTVINNGVPEIVLTPGNTEECTLSYLELYHVEGYAGNVTLSACNTANGEVVSYEGVMGLVRGFHKLGASNIQSSLWVVNDKSTSLFMKHFYHYMVKEALSPAAAVKHVKLIMIGKSDLEHSYENSVFSTRYQHPFFWASFISIGID